MLIAAVTGWDIMGSYRAHRQVVERQMAMLAGAAGAQVQASVRAVDLLLEDAAQAVDLDHWPDPDAESWLRARLASFPEVRNLIVVDPSGRMVGANLSRHETVAGTGVDLSDREYFGYHRDHWREPALHIALPVVSRMHNQPSLPMSRPLRSRDGGFGGLVVVGLDPSYFESVLRTVAVENGMTATLLRRDGIILARSSGGDVFRGRSVADGAVLRDHLPRSPSGVVTTLSPLDGQERLIGYRALIGSPLVALVTMPLHSAFGDWRQRAAQGAATVLVLSAAVLLLAFRLERRERARAQLAATLDQHRRTLEGQVAERTASLAASNAKLVASNAELEAFAYVASHDLQEPLRTIVSFLQLLDRRYGDRVGPEGHEFIAYAVEGAKRMSCLIRDLLAFSRVGSVEHISDPVDTGDVVEEVLESLRGAIGDSGAVVTVGPLPTVTGVREQIASVFLNLIGNAIKYRAPDCTPDVRIEAAREGGFWCFSVTDNGIGIGPEYLDRVFGIFQRLHTQTDQPGTGIGLALVRKIVERHGGRVWATSTGENGTTLRFTLPADAPGP